MKSLIDNKEPTRLIRLHKFNGLRSIRQAYPCTVTDFIENFYFLIYLVHI